MALVDYSDSEDSDAPDTNVAKPSTTSSGKPAFQKVVDRSNPGKIKVSLPQAALKEGDTSNEPPTKRAKTGGGAFGAFNSFLPAPKRSGQATGTSLGGGNGARKGGLAAGVSLKTGAAPGFSREPEPEREHEVKDTAENHDAEPAESGSEMGLPPPKSLVDEQKPPEEVKLVGKPLMFRPLSVARKPAKKKPQNLSSITSTPTTVQPRDSPDTPSTPQTDSKTAKPQPKLSLFSLEVESVANTPTTSTPSSGTYHPLLYQPSPSTTSNSQPIYESSSTPTTPHFAHLPSVPTPPLNANFDSLHTIADSLHLSAAERRQLFGRNNKNNNAQATKIINFNTDEEYKHNEELRQAGEQVVHNPVRAIAPGKHSLKQLVTAAQSQKEALEESFASGRNNRKEAGSKYGW
ncbi:stress activated map kinase interacting protein [Rutstroemia sp. NJR-2017a BVV2]|nr:stress activated map kinase interacting protein [Rutstroemia sp. NJR-2017a BVV2]